MFSYSTSQIVISIGQAQRHYSLSHLTLVFRNVKDPLFLQLKKCHVHWLESVFALPLDSCTHTISSNLISVRWSLSDSLAALQLDGAVWKWRFTRRHSPDCRVLWRCCQEVHWALLPSYWVISWHFCMSPYCPGERVGEMLDQRSSWIFRDMAGRMGYVWWYHCCTLCKACAQWWCIFYLKVKLWSECPGK